MKKTLLSFACALCLAFAFNAQVLAKGTSHGGAYSGIYGPGTGSSSSSHTVSGHVRQDGAYIPPHRATNPDGNFQNNWSTKPNVNPYTGKEGAKTRP